VRPELSALEARVIASLIEKEISTPDQYPLTLKALVAACNQKSNRDPVVELAESEVQALVDGLMKKHLVTDRSGGFGGRVTRYRHRFCNTQFGDLQLTPREVAILCELMLRGAQTPGELRGRASRLADFGEVGEVEGALEDLAAREEPLVARLAREPGKRESRWMQLFTGETPPEAVAIAPSSVGGSRDERLARLEAQVEALESELRELARRLEGFSAG
jgi:uncharacterized protein